MPHRQFSYSVGLLLALLRRRKFAAKRELGKDYAVPPLELGAPPDTLRLERLTEGLSLQTLHIGSYDDDGPILAHLHGELMPTERLDFNGWHHETYLSDPHKAPPDKLKAILRQPATTAREAP